MKTTISWNWDEAFSKFGFGDGDESNFTSEVASVINGMGYECKCDTWGIHNYMIMDIKKDGVSIMPQTVKVGYTEPREWLLKPIIEELDKHFPDDV